MDETMKTGSQWGCLASVAAERGSGALRSITMTAARTGPGCNVAGETIWPV